MELMIMRQDIDRVLEYLGKESGFEMQREGSVENSSSANVWSEMFTNLQSCRNWLGIQDSDGFSANTSLPTDADTELAGKILTDVEHFRKKELEAAELHKRVAAAYEEALSFANLKVAYSELEHLTFLSFKIGKIDPSLFDELKFAVGERGVIVPLGEDRTRILAAASKKGRFALDSELKRFGFIPLEVPEGFKGVPADVLEGLKRQNDESLQAIRSLATEKKRYAENTAADLVRLLEAFSLGAQVRRVRESLESTQLVYRVLGWVGSDEREKIMHDLDGITEGRIAIRVYSPEEVPSIKSGREKVPVQYRHGAFVRSFERMIFSYGAPLYGTIDPTPIVAFFFTLLFGIMFGDLGQGLVFFLLGILLMKTNTRFLRAFKHFGPIVTAVGCSSMVMGLLTGEFFANSTVLRPFSRWVTGLYGPPQDHILHMMPSSDTIGKLFVFFGFTVAIGFIINSIGLVINIINNFSLGKPAKAIFSKTGVCGALFFWYSVATILRIAFAKTPFYWFDAIFISLPLIGIFFAEPIIRTIEGHHPAFENGLFSAIIEGIVEILEVVSTYISNSVSFLRVGAFALSHAVLSFIIFTMTNLVGGSLSAGGILVAIFGNLIIIVLEGLIVTIQVIRLQYYEFFSKFFTETGREFKPFRFTYQGDQK